MPPTPVPTQSEAPLFVRWLPRVLTIVAVFMLVQLITPAGSWLDRFFEFMWRWFVPFTPVDFVTSVVFIVLAAALAIRKRAAWWITLVFLSIIFALYAVILYGFIVFAPDEMTGDLFTGMILPVIVFIGLIVHRRWYNAKTQPRGFLKAIGVLALGIVITAAIILVVQYFIGGLTGVQARQIIAELAGLKESTEASWMLSVFGFGTGASIILAFWTGLRSARDAERIDIDQERRIREGLAAHSSDSLGYFGTRRDRSAFFADDCVITYQVHAGVCLVASDPVGPPQQWAAAARSFVAHAESFGWVPAVLAASKQGAQAYHDAGLKVLHVGDEAVLHTKNFTLSALPEVQRAVTKLTGLGYTIRIRHQSEIPAAELEELAIFADEWRDGENERGFSMALGRFGDPADGGNLFVEALFPADAGTLAGTTAGLLGFVPWGASGVSLDVMRRHPFAENGVTEFMVAGLMREAGDLGIAAVSLNFAVFRSAFEQGKELGAGPLKRLCATSSSTSPGSGSSNPSIGRTRSTIRSGCRACSATRRDPTSPASVWP